MNGGALVVDASLVFKWLIDEDLSEEANSLFDDAERSRVSLNAPPIVRSETTNALYQRYRRRELSAADAEETLTTLLALPITIIDDDDVYSGALALALQHGFNNTYDCLYASLASILEVDYWTADRRFFEAFGRVSARVRWLGDYPLAPVTDA